jgi:hypothetical protein
MIWKLAHKVYETLMTLNLQLILNLMISKVVSCFNEGICDHHFCFLLSSSSSQITTQITLKEDNHLNCS